MNLETEFRIRLQLKALEQQLFGAAGKQDCSNCLTSETEVAPSTWVKLRQRPDSFSLDEAMLLCQCEGDQWVAWVPDYGEIVLFSDDFQAL